MSASVGEEAVGERRLAQRQLQGIPIHVVYLAVVHLHLGLLQAVAPCSQSIGSAMYVAVHKHVVAACFVQGYAAPLCRESVVGEV